MAERRSKAERRSMAGRPIERRKVADEVVARILDSIFDRRLRPGDRLDIDAIAAELGVSRIPVREALIHLERDGLLNSRYHRGVYLNRIDTAFVEEHFEIYGMLSGLAASRIAARRDPEVIAQLERAIAAYDEIPAGDVDGWEQASQQFLRVLHDEGGGPLLRSLIRTFNGFVPRSFETVRLGAYEMVRSYMVNVLDALRAGDADAAREIFATQMKNVSASVLQHLRQIGVVDD